MTANEVNELWRDSIVDLPGVKSRSRFEADERNRAGIDVRSATTSAIAISMCSAAARQARSANQNTYANGARMVSRQITTKVKTQLYVGCVEGRATRIEPMRTRLSQPSGCVLPGSLALRFAAWQPTKREVRVKLPEDQRETFTTQDLNHSQTPAGVEVPLMDVADGEPSPDAFQSIIDATGRAVNQRLHGRRTEASRHALISVLKNDELPHSREFPSITVDVRGGSERGTSPRHVRRCGARSDCARRHLFAARDRLFRD